MLSPRGEVEIWSSIWRWPLLVLDGDHEHIENNLRQGPPPRLSFVNSRYGSWDQQIVAATEERHE